MDYSKSMNAIFPVHSRVLLCPLDLPSRLEVDAVGVDRIMGISIRQRISLFVRTIQSLPASVKWSCFPSSQYLQFASVVHTVHLYRHRTGSMEQNVPVNPSDDLNASSYRTMYRSLYSMTNSQDRCGFYQPPFVASRLQAPRSL